MWYNERMKRIIFAAMVFSACALSASAFSPEALRGSSSADFNGLPEAKSAVLASRNVRIFGEVELRGRGRIPLQDQGVSMLLSGAMDVTDEHGRVLARDVQVAYVGFLKVSGSSVSGQAYPEVYVPLYREGRYIGSAKLGGPVFVSGHASGDWALVSGRGRLWGYFALQD